MLRGRACTSAGVFMPDDDGVEWPEPGRLVRVMSVDEREAMACCGKCECECDLFPRPKPWLRLVKGFMEMWKRPWRFRLAVLLLCTYVLSLLIEPARLAEERESAECRVGLLARLFALLPCRLAGRLTGRLAVRLCAVESGGVFSTGERTS